MHRVNRSDFQHSTLGRHICPGLKAGHTSHGRQTGQQHSKSSPAAHYYTLRRTLPVTLSSSIGWSGPIALASLCGDVSPAPQLMEK